jgi:hypothetical protein
MDPISYKPYVWLESISTSASKLHFVVSLPIGIELITDVPRPDDNFDMRRRILVYKVSGEVVEPTSRPFEISYPLDESTGYDPVLDDIIVQIVEEGTMDKKGQAATHHSEGDASGGG